jgi:L-threonylcarbamoyladenylate synthase
LDIYSVSELPKIRNLLKERLLSGQVAVFPTDTIYGFTADARHHGAVERILDLKQRRTPISCIPHSLDWVRRLIRTDYQDIFDQRVKEFMGPFTMLWPSHPAERLVHPLIQTDELVGLRFPHHWILEFAQETGIPLTTTSVNRTGEPAMNDRKSLNPDLIQGIDFLLDEGPLLNAPSTLVRCDTPEFLLHSRQ